MRRSKTRTNFRVCSMTSELLLPHSPYTPTLKYIEHIVTCVPTPLFTTSHHTNLVWRSKWIQQHRNFFDVAACGDLLLFSLPISLPNSSKLKATESREQRVEVEWKRQTRVIFLEHEQFFYMYLVLYILNAFSLHCSCLFVSNFNPGA